MRDLSNIRKNWRKSKKIKMTVKDSGSIELNNELKTHL